MSLICGIPEATPETGKRTTMKYLITYFYNVRFLKPNQFPFSTAVWDPKWYHEFLDQDHVFKDKNGVWNGLRVEPLHPDVSCEWATECIECDHEKKGNCDFIHGYENQLKQLNFNLILNYFEQTIKHLDSTVEDPEVVILVHEKPDNPCSERHPLIKWFKENGIDLIEFNNKQ